MCDLGVPCGKASCPYTPFRDIRPEPCRCVYPDKCSCDPDETNEGIERLDLRDALKMIAYPVNWPDNGESWPGQWFQSVAANALTNAGTYNYERKAKP